MSKSLGFANVRGLAYSVRNAMERSGWPPVSARPYNPYDADNCLWWLIPSADFPAYHHGKFFFVSEPVSGDSVFTGLHVEKGLGEVASSVMTSAKDRRCIMTEKWLWRNFVEDVSSGRLDDALGDISARCSVSLVAHVKSHLYAGGDFDPYAVEQEADRVVLQWQSGSLSVDELLTKTPDRILPPLLPVASLPELMAAADGLEQADWLWTDVYVGAEFTLDPGKKDFDSWSGEKLLGEFLLPLHPWLR